MQSGSTPATKGEEAIKAWNKKERELRAQVQRLFLMCIDVGLEMWCAGGWSAVLCVAEPRFRRLVPVSQLCCLL